MGLQNVVSIGEQVNIRDNINPGGGGEYLDQEGIFGVKGTLPGNGGQVAFLMLAGVDTAELTALDKTCEYLCMYLCVCVYIYIYIYIYIYEVVMEAKSLC